MSKQTEPGSAFAQASGSLTTARAAAIGLELCEFLAEKPRDCDKCRAAIRGSHVFVRLSGNYEGAALEAEYYVCAACALKECEATENKKLSDGGEVQHG